MAADKLRDLSQPIDVSLLDATVAAFYGTGSKEERNAADQILRELQNNPDTWLQVVDILSSTQNLNTKFFALQVLEGVIKYRWNSLPVQQRDGMKNYISEVIVKLSSDEISFRRERLYVNKLNIILVQILKHEWPARWPNFVPDLVAAAKTSETICENCMVILKLLSEEVFDFSRGEMTQQKIKDLKQSLNSEFQLIHELCLYVLSASQRAELIRATLATLHAFLSWIPLGYIFESPLLETLLKFFPLPSYRNLTLQCLTEVAALNFGDFYNDQYAKLYSIFMLHLQAIVPSSSKIPEAYANGSSEEQAFIQNLALFFTSFFKCHIRVLESTQANISVLLAGLEYLIDISYVDDTEVFKVCLDYWNSFVSELFEAHHNLNNPGSTGNMMGLQMPFLNGVGSDVLQRRQLYATPMSKLRLLMICRMAKPEEVLIVEDENGNIVRETMKDNDVLVQYKIMRETLIYLSHLDHEDTEKQMLRKLSKQLNGEDWTWNNLNTLCWAIGSISGSMMEEQENRFLVMVIRDLLNLCEIIKGKDNKAVIASNIMYVVGQYPRFLRAHWKFLKTVVNKLFEFMHEMHPGVQDMACDTFLKIVQKCRRKFVIVQVGESEPFVSELLTTLPTTIADLEHHQIHTFYESVGNMIQAESDPQKRDEYLQRLMELPNQKWTEIIGQARQSVEFLKDQVVIRAVLNILQTNTSVAASLGTYFLPQVSLIFMDMLGVYRMYSEHISASIAEFPDTIMVFMKKQIHFLCSQKKASLLEVLKKPAKETVGVEVVMHVKTKSDDGTALMDSIFRAIHGQSKSDGHDTPIVGHIAREAPEGNLLETWAEKLKSEELQLVDITNGFSDLFAVKDSNEITNVKKAAYLTSSVMKHFVVPKLEKVIDEEKKISHSTLMDDTEKVILDPAKAKVKLKAENVDICYPPIFQSGGEFDLRPSASSNDEHLYFDSTSVIICAIGSRYNSYCSNIARTFLIDANTVQSKAYEVLLRAHEAAIGALKSGNKVSAAYQAAISIVEKDAPELVAHVTKSAGTGIGLEFRESGLNLNSKNDRMLKAGMVFNVSLGFQNLQTDTMNPKTQKISLLLADTVIVGVNAPEVVTSTSSKAVKDVAYSFNEEEEEEEKQRPKVNPEANGADASSSKATLRSVNHETSKEELRRQHQAELARQKNEETARRLAGGGSGTMDNRGAMRGSGELNAYKNINDLPTPRDLMIQIDQKHEAILLPVHGSMVPFHVATVKSVTSQQDTNRTCYIRIIFNVPGTPFNPYDSNSLKYQGSIYIKEVSFRSRDPRHSSEIVQQIKTLRRQVASRESERAERATLVTQEKLQVGGAKFKPIRLLDLWIRPVFGGRGRKLTGTLEAHANGFRYSTSRQDERADIMYGNIKHAFFQPAEKEMITLLHFHLHNHIMVGNKKSKDVQFYAEVMDVVQTIGGGKRSAYDPDEIEEEQRERARKNKINMDFQNFVNRVNDLWGQPQFKGHDLEFDQPLRELGFHGVPHKSSAFIVPTSSCLVELIETPFVVITLSEIEIVNLERVGLGQKNFDMTVVFKDFKRDVFRIDSIPSTSLDGIKEWLDTTDLKYYESRLNLNWRPILKTITDDPEKFIEDGGWEFLNMEASDSESENSQESDKGYVPSDAQSESASEEEDDDDSASLVDSEEDEEEDSDEVSEEEEGKTWEELEKEAVNADKEKGAESDSEEERARRKIKAFGKSRVPDKRHPSGSLPKRPRMR